MALIHLIILLLLSYYSQILTVKSNLNIYIVDEIQINKYLKTDITQLTAKSIKWNIDKNISLFFSKLRLRALNRKKYCDL